MAHRRGNQSCQGCSDQSPQLEERRCLCFCWRPGLPRSGLDLAARLLEHFAREPGTIQADFYWKRRGSCSSGHRSPAAQRWQSSCPFDFPDQSWTCPRSYAAAAQGSSYHSVTGTAAMSNSCLFPTTLEAPFHPQRLGHIAVLSVFAVATALAAGRCVSGQSMAYEHFEYDSVPVDSAGIDQGADSDFDSAGITAGWQGSACFADIAVDSDHTFAAAEGAAFAIASENWFGNIVAATGAAVDARAVAASFVDRFIAASGFIEA